MLKASHREGGKRKEKIMERKQFTFYKSFYESIEKLPTNKEKLQAYQLICDYALTQKEPDLETVKQGAATVFRISRPILDTAHKRASLAKKLTEPLPSVSDDIPKMRW
jgi:hypothetical protein